jgi:hypothetical protein
MRILTDTGYIDSVGLFFELTDKQLEIVKANKDYYLDKKLVDEFTKGYGKNAHFIGACNNGDRGVIGRKIKLLLRDYKTVSWWDKDMQEFKIVRRD